MCSFFEPARRNFALLSSTFSSAKRLCIFHFCGQFRCSHMRLIWDIQLRSRRTSPFSEVPDDILHIILHPTQFIDKTATDEKAECRKQKAFGTAICQVCRRWAPFGRVLLYSTTTIALGARYLPELNLSKEPHNSSYIWGIDERNVFAKGHPQNVAEPVLVRHKYFEGPGFLTQLREAFEGRKIICKEQIFTTLCTFHHILSYIRRLDIVGLGIFDKGQLATYDKSAKDLTLASVETREHWSFADITWILIQCESLVELNISDFFAADRFLYGILRFRKSQLQKVRIDFRTKAETGPKDEYPPISRSSFQHITLIEPQKLFELIRGHGPQLKTVHIVGCSEYQDRSRLYKRPIGTPLMHLDCLKVGGIYGMGLRMHLGAMLGPIGFTRKPFIFEFVCASALRTLELPLILSFILHLWSKQDDLGSLVNLSFTIPVDIRISTEPREKFVVNEEIFSVISQMLSSLKLRTLSFGSKLGDITVSELSALLYSLPASLRSLQFSGDRAPREHSLLMVEFLSSGHCPSLDDSVLQSE